MPGELNVMIRTLRLVILLSAAAAAAASSSACVGGTASAAAATTEPAPVAVRAAAVESQPIDRFVRVTGSLAADEQADVAAEPTGRIVSTPVERGTRVQAGAVHARISGT
jgi:multidrug efflux pump subunit AcrA (membrane-fusion protein)